MTQKVKSKNDLAFRWLAQILGIGTLITSCAFFYRGTDPVNLPKFFCLGITSCAILGVLGFRMKKFYKSENRMIYFALGVFILALLNSLLFSGAPRIQMWYGTFARNDGFLTYFALAVCFLGASMFRKKEDIRIVVKFLLLIGLFNSIFSFLEILGFNLLKGDNFFNVIIGNLGNPDFVSAFFGIFASSCFAYLLGNSIKYPIRLSLLGFIGISLFYIKESHSRQGLMVFIAGIILSSLIRLYFIHSKKVYFYIEIIMAGLVILIGILGALNIGPLAKYIFKSSISIRREYWLAALNMLKDHPLTGVGLNSYGDYYRASRNPSALIFPGPNTFSNAAHNVYLDFAATGGLPLITAYLGIMVIVGFAALAFLRKSEHYDPIFVAILLGWTGYSIQAFISIDQIGIAILGWVCAGLLISYRNIGRDSIPNLDSRVTTKEKSKRFNAPKEDLSLQSLGLKASAIAGAVVGVLIFIPPIAKDVEWRNRFNEGNVKPILATAISWPLDENRMSNTISLFRNNSLNKDALQVALIGVKNFPRSFYIHDSIYTNPEATREQRSNALKIMKELDPHNPAIQSLVAP